MRNLLVVLLLTGISAGNSFAGSRDTPTQNVRQPAVAGRFYSGEADALRREVSGYLDAAPRPVQTAIPWAVVAPHAGYVFSAGIAARAHEQLAAGDYDTVVVIGHDSHRPGIAFLCDVDAFETPLGRVQVDRDMLKAMLSYNRGIQLDRRMHAQEHTIEVQLPFFQVLGKAWKIVPVLFGTPTPDHCRILAQAIRHAAGDRRVLVFASTDMSHYPPYDDACRIDKQTLKVIQEFDVDRLFKHLQSPALATGVRDLKTAMCASGGVGTAMVYAAEKGATEVRVLGYANSGDVPQGNKRGVVGYGAVVFSRKVQEPPAH